MSSGLEHHQLIFNKATELMKSIIQSPLPIIAKVRKVFALDWAFVLVYCGSGPPTVNANERAIESGKRRKSTKILTNK